MVDQAIVSGAGQAQPYGLVVLAEGLRAKVSDTAVRARVEAEMLRLFHAANEGLASHERLERMVISPEPWSVDNGCLTPTMKIKRSRIEATVASRVDDWYARPGPVVWA
jgi:long-chain acyl-CoA synthetase